MAFACEPDRVLEAARERELAVALVRRAEARYGAGRGEGRRGEAAKGDLGLAGEFVERRALRRAAAAVEVAHLARGGVVDEPERIAADAAHVRVEDAERGGGGNRRVDRRAAVAQRLRAR